MNYRVSGLAIASFCVFIAGCGSDAPTLVNVSGKAMHSHEPLIAGSIWFHPDPGNEVIGEPSSCVLQMDGSFKMRTYPFGDGVPPGKYKVTFSPELAGRIKLPKLGNPAETPLELLVPDEGLTDIVVEAKK